MNLILRLLLQYRYLVLVPLAAFEGPVVSLVVGFLVRTGILSFLPAYLILVAGDIGPDSIFFAIGHFGQEAKVVKKYLSGNNFFANHFNLIEKLWNDHPRKTMFFGKLAYGFALPFLVSAGMSKMPYKKFITYTIPVSFFQYGIIMLVGYLSGSLYYSAAKYVNLAYIIMAGLAVLFVFGFVKTTKYAKKKVTEIEEEEIVSTSSN